MQRLPRFANPHREPPLPESIISRPIIPSPRFNQRPIFTPLRPLTTLIINYVAPAIYQALEIGLRLFRAQIIPRILAAAAALIDPSTPRFRPRGETLIILPIVYINPYERRPPVLDEDVTTPFTLPAAPYQSSELPTPTYVTPFAVVIGLSHFGH